MRQTRHYRHDDYHAGLNKEQKKDIRDALVSGS
jgi:hypothetical protein